jgi:uncharacterized membrane protein
MSEATPEPSRPRTPDEINAVLWGVSPRRQRYNRLVTDFTNGIGDHWLAILNTVLGIFIGLSALGPILYALGFNGPASMLFDGYRFVCGQTPSHSFYIAGYQMCLCSRCLAIYSSILIGGLFLVMYRRRQFFELRPLSWRLWVVGMLPMALDGGTQLFGLHESNVYLRLLTGTIFGLCTAWFVLPQIEGSTPRATLAKQPGPQASQTA